MKILCLIPARSGSKGLKNKNIKKIHGKSLIEITYKFARKFKLFRNIVVSTDSKNYLKKIKDKNYSLPFLRPKKLAKDNTTDLDLMIHELKRYEKFFNVKYDYLCLLQPTSPLRKVKHLKACIKIIKKSKPDAIWSVSPIDKKFHPIKQVFIKNGYLNYFQKDGKNFVSRQKLQQSYIRNGVVYFFSRRAILQVKSILPKKTKFLIIDKNKIANIDNKIDLKFAIKNFQPND